MDEFKTTRPLVVFMVLLLTAQVVRAQPADIVKDSPLLARALTEPDFFSRLDDRTYQQTLRKELADAKFRKVGEGRSVRVQLWRATTTENAAIVLEYQTAFKRFTDLMRAKKA